MKRSRPKTRWSLIAILLVAAALTYAGFRYLYPPQKSEIFLVEDPGLTYGNTTLSGVLTKDTRANQVGQFAMILDDQQVILLDIEGVDQLLGQKVVAKGLLIPPEGIVPGYMQVDQLTTGANP